MVAAFDRITDYRSHMQREMPMWASILQRHNGPIARAKKDNILAENGPANGLLGQLVRPQGYVPTIPQIHFCSPENLQWREALDQRQCFRTLLSLGAQLAHYY
jgi:hypothetical protein